MENAIKALYMAIGVLIGILVLTLFVYVFSQGRKYMTSVNDEETSRIAQEYNSKLLVYVKDKNKINDDIYNSVYDIISACNLAYDINKQYDFDNKTNLEIVMNIGGTSHTLISKDLQKNKTLKKRGEINYDGLKNISYLLEEDSIVGETLNTLERNVDNSETEYKYKFDGVAGYDSNGKINKIIFTYYP